MSFGRKIANRIVLAYLAPLAFTLGIGILFIHLRGDEIRLRDYALGMVLVLIPAAVIGRLLTAPMTLHLEQLRRGAERIERGDYGARVAPTSEDELAELARAFNHMADVIAQREGDLRRQNETLAALNHRFEAVLNAANDGIAMLDRGGCFVLVNRRFGELLGTRADALVHHTLEEARPLLIESLAHRLADLAPEHERGVAEEIIALGGGGPDRRFLQFYTAPVLGEDGREAIGRIVALRDITRERELDKMKTDFISVVSHELRTPLTSIKGYTDLLLSGAAGEVSELQSEFLGIIEGSTTRLSNLINDILDISRIESGTIEIKHEPIDYRAIVSDTLRLLKAAADAKHVSMDASLPAAIPPVRGDTDKVTQVLTNLVSNAIKYTPAGGWIKVSLEVAGEASVTTCVADGGIGIAPDDRKRLFQRFFRADNTSTREAGGTGLGLVIAKTIIELLGGTIWVESEPGRGSRFYFTLPLFLESAGGDAPAAVALPERGIGLILIVDGDAYVRSLLRHALHRRGYGTLEAAGADEAVQKARLHKPDAVTLNMMMPDGDALRTLRALRADRATRGLAAVAVSVQGDPSRGDLTLGAFSLLPSPVRASDIRRALDAAGGGADALGVGGCDDALVAALAAEGVTLHVAGSAPEAVGRAILTMPALIVIDAGLPDADLFALIQALKAEDEAARIPIALVTDGLGREGLPFRVRGGGGEGAGPLDALCEHLARVLAAPEPPLADDATGDRVFMTVGTDL